MKRVHLFGFAVIAIVISSCRKMDISQQIPPNPTNTEIAKKFFTLPASTTESVARVANYIRAQNDVKGFAEKLVRFDGYAQWDKTYIQVANDVSSAIVRTNSKAANAASSSGNSPDTILYIPMVPEGANYVYSFIWAKLNGSQIDWRLFSGRDYDTHPNGAANSQDITAEKIAMISMVLDNRTFGYTDFVISDKNLFSKNKNVPAGENITVKLVNKQTPVGESGVKTNGFYILDLCFWVGYKECPFIASSLGHCFGPGGICDGCPKCLQYQLICDMPKIISIPDGEGGPVPAGTYGPVPPPGGGTGGDDGIPGNGDSPDDPCDVNSPCGRQGWTAEEALARNLMTDLELNFAEMTWLEDFPEYAIDIRDYLTNSPAAEPEKIELANKHLDELRIDTNYLQFVSTYKANYPDEEDMWWENSSFLSNPANHPPIFNSKDDTTPETIADNSTDMTGADFTDYGSYDQSQPWPTVPSLFKKAEFVGWRAPGITVNCLDYAKAQMAKKGCYPAPRNTTGQFWQLLDSSGVQHVSVAKEAVNAINALLQDSKPVLVGVQSHTGLHPSNADKATDHFIVIVGAGVEPNGTKYYLFYDNAANHHRDPDLGAHAENKLIWDETNGTLTGQTKAKYADGLTRNYSVTQVRKTRKP